MFSSKLATTIFLLLVLGCTDKNVDCEKSDPDVVIPTTVVVPEPVNSFTPERLVDLSNIVFALEIYKREHRSYPISANSGESWDSLFVESGGIANENWIKGLAPKYIDVLPTDPRKSSEYDQQYRYRSDGANYKLLSLRPDDCQYVKSILPKVIFHLGECWAYGFWTQGAAAW